MTKTQQKSFVNQLSRNIARTICNKIDCGRIPAHWDGNQLRVLLADAHRESAAISLIRKYPRDKRAKEFRNTVLVQNL